MLERLARLVVEEQVALSPGVLLLGPRQCGKTTLIRSFGGRYYDLEQESDRLALDLEWPDLVRGRELLLLDEAQSWPDLFPRLRGEIDRDRRRNRRFLLTGSVAPGLLRQVSETLAGRLAIVELSPFLVPEVGEERARDLWLRGGFPDGGILDPRRFPRWPIDYLALLAQRDLPEWGLPAAPSLIDRFLRMLAAANGTIWNASDLSRSLGISYQTVDSYCRVLEGAFLVRRLHPWLPNIRKRLVKRPKLHFRDTGLLHALLGVRDRTSLLRQPWVGASFETFVVQQVTGLATLLDPGSRAWFFRTSDGYEVDLVLEFFGETWAIEAKLAGRVGTDDFEKLDRAADLCRADRRFVVSMTTAPAGTDRRASANLSWFADLLRRTAEANLR